MNCSIHEDQLELDHWISKSDRRSDQFKVLIFESELLPPASPLCHILLTDGLFLIYSATGQMVDWVKRK